MLHRTHRKRAPDFGPRERLIETGRELFCRHGINAVGVDTIVQRAGTAKTTLYKLFGSKDGLVEAVLLTEGAEWRTWFFASISHPGSSPCERLDAIFTALEKWFGQKRFYGCPFINAVAEHDKASVRIRQIALDHKMLVLERIRHLCAEAGARDPDRLTHEIALLIDGAIVTAMITRKPATAACAHSAMRALVAQQTTA